MDPVNTCKKISIWLFHTALHYFVRFVFPDILVNILCHILTVQYLAHLYTQLITHPTTIIITGPIATPCLTNHPVNFAVFSINKFNTISFLFILDGDYCGTFFSLYLSHIYHQQQLQVGLSSTFLSCTLVTFVQQPSVYEHYFVDFPDKKYIFI